MTTVPAPLAGSPDLGRSIDVAVVGAGPAGLSAAVLFADLGFTTALVAPASRPGDLRTTALLGGSLPFYRFLGLEPAIRASGAELAVMRLVDDTGRLLRAPEATFRAREIGEDAFGINIANADLVRILEARAAETPGLVRIEATVADVALGTSHASLALADGTTLAARLVVAADGRRSSLREAAGITTSTWAHPQSALVLNLAHEAPHEDTSTEFHRPAGPFVLVPLPGGRRSSVVLVDRPEEVERLAGLDDDALARDLEARSHHLLGRMTVEGGRATWPLSSMVARRQGRHRVALVGEAAHAFPPIGAQGLNLSLRDIAALAEIAADVRDHGGDIGDDDVLARFERARRLDVESRARGVDVVNRILLSEALPVQALRAAGLHLAVAWAPLRRLMMREGMTPGWAAPRLMRGLDLARRRRSAGG